LQTTTSQTVTVAKNDEGQAVIFITTDDGNEPMEIVLEKDGKVILIDGKELKFNASAITINKLDLPQGLMQLNHDFKDLRTNFDGLKLEKDMLLKWNGAGSVAGVRAFDDKEFWMGKEDLKKLNADQAKMLKEFNKQFKGTVDADQFQFDTKALQEYKFYCEKELADQARVFQPYIKNDHVFFFNHGHGNHPSAAIENELVKDGLIEKHAAYKLELNKNSMKINGNKVPDDVFEKYKKLYDSDSENKKSGNQQFIIRKKDDK